MCMYVPYYLTPIHTHTHIHNRVEQGWVVNCDPVNIALTPVCITTMQHMVNALQSAVVKGRREGQVLAAAHPLPMNVCACPWVFVCACVCICT